MAGDAPNAPAPPARFDAPHIDPLRLDLPAIHQAIRAGTVTPTWLRDWLPATYAAPERFTEALYSFAQSKRGGLLKSRPREGIDLYHDCMLAHLGRRKTAVAVREDGEWVEASYEAIHARASSLATEWARAGVEAGQTLCVVAPVGVDYAAAILAGFRLGLVVSAIPPVGESFVATRLEAIEPDHVATSSRTKPLVGRFAATALPIVSAVREAPTQTSHVYEPDDVAMRLVSPLREEGPRVFDLPASLVHRSLLRDALVVYALDATDAIAAPGFDPLQHQPQLLLTALMAGATWVQLELRDVEADPRALDGARVTLIGVHRTYRALLAARGVDPLRGCRAWFRSGTEVLDILAWDHLTRLFAEKKVPGFQVVANAATGGAVLFGPRTVGTLGLVMWPVPGETWQLSEVAAGTLPALNDAGAYTILRGEAGEEDESIARFVLTKLDDAYIYAGSIDIGPDAQAYPCREIARVAERHPGVRHAAAIVAAGRWVNDARTVLLVFTEPARDAEGHLVPGAPVHELRALVAREMGETRVPDRIEVFPLHPRRREGHADASWCRSQYLSGALTEKSRSDLFVLLAELAYIFAGEAPAE